MKKSFIAAWGVTCLTVLAGAMAAQAPPVKLKLRAALVDKDLNVKPVPRLALRLRNLDNPLATPIELRTELDGTLEAAMPAGRYELATLEPVEFQVAFFTPIVSYFLRYEDEMAAARKAAKRSGADPSQVKPPADALENGRWLPPLMIPEGGTSLEEVERALVELALRQAEGNQTHAARLLDISRDALRYKMKKFGLMHTEGSAEIEAESA